MFLQDVANVMNALYTPLNIYVALTGVIVWTQYDEIEMVTDGDRMLTNFLHYRKVSALVCCEAHVVVVTLKIVKKGGKFN